MIDGLLRFDNELRFISKAKFDNLSNGKLVDGDFVILLRGTVGKTAAFEATAEHSTGFINAQMLIIRMINAHVRDFFNVYRSSSFFQSLIAAKTTGSAVRQMPANVLLEFLFPLPPLAEQKRIVAKVSKMMTLCDELEAHLTKSETKAERLMESVVYHLATA